MRWARQATGLIRQPLQLITAGHASCALQTRYGKRHNFSAGFQFKFLFDVGSVYVHCSGAQVQVVRRSGFCSASSIG